jgi:hypothetical protein
MGHHSPAFTLATYVHLLPDDLPAASFLDAVTAPGPRATDGQQDEPRTTETPKPLIAVAPPNEAETSDVRARRERSGLLLIRGSKVRILPGAQGKPRFGGVFC